MRVLREINRGGFGRVEAVELDDGTVVARKVFDPAPEVALATDPDKLVDRFKREVRVQSALPAQFFMPILDYDLDDPSPWYTMPMADRNYKTQIEQDRAGGTVNQEALAQILESLAELHSLGFTHRDLKPENILLHNGRWKLSDFGLVLPPAGNTTTLTSTGSTWGTQLYCAPEQAQDFRHVTARADIYSFGCILHDLFCGESRIPFQRQTCSHTVGVIVEKCTEINPNRRFRTVDAVRGALFSLFSKPPGLTTKSFLTIGRPGLPDTSEGGIGYWPRSRVRRS